MSLVPAQTQGRGLSLRPLSAPLPRGPGPLPRAKGTFLGCLSGVGGWDQELDRAAGTCPREAFQVAEGTLFSLWASPSRVSCDP